MTTRSALAPSTAVTWVVKSVSVVWNFWTVTVSRPSSLMASWKVVVSEEENASFWA